MSVCTCVHVSVSVYTCIGVYVEVSLRVHVYVSVYGDGCIVGVPVREDAQVYLPLRVWWICMYTLDKG